MTALSSAARAGAEATRAAVPAALNAEGACAGPCAYGGCGRAGMQGCGGCCYCLGGCQVQWENEQRPSP